MISVVRYNCNGFISQNSSDTRAKMLIPLALLTDCAAMENSDENSILYKKACDLFAYIVNMPENGLHKRFNLLASELEYNYGRDKLGSYGILSKDELQYIIDFIDSYGGFKVYQ